MIPMIGKFLTGLLAPAPVPTAAPEAKLALAALLVRLARADGHYSEDEISRIEVVLGTRYTLDPHQAEALRREAEVLEADAADTVRFTRALKDAVPHEDRMGIMSALWQVALADRERDAEEDALIRLAASLLGISDRDSAIARQRVEAHQ